MPEEGLGLDFMLEPIISMHKPYVQYLVAPKYPPKVQRDREVTLNLDPQNARKKDRCGGVRLESQCWGEESTELFGQPTFQ